MRFGVDKVQGLGLVQVGGQVCPPLLTRQGTCLSSCEESWIYLEIFHCTSFILGELPFTDARDVCFMLVLFLIRRVHSAMTFMVLLNVLHTYLGKQDHQAGIDLF